MTFKHKLSSRLALMRDRSIGVTAIVAALVSCQLPIAENATSSTSLVVQLFVVPESLSLDPHQQRQFTAYGRTAAGDSAVVPIVWSATGGTITTTGMFTAGDAPGDYAVRGTNSMFVLTASSRVHITGTAPVAAVVVLPASASLTAGQTLQLGATSRDAANNVLTGRAVTWSSTNTAVATINGTGVLTAVATGSATITATSESKSGTAAVTVTATAAPVATVTVSPSSPSVTAGQTVQLAATLRDAGGNVLTSRAVAWGSSNTGVATVNGSGTVTGAAAGSAAITATSEGKSGGTTVTVVQPPAPVASVTVAPGSASVTAGQTVQLTATPKDAGGTPLTGRVVTWGSSNTGVTTVNGTGFVTGVAAGSATITATSEGKTGSAALTITPAATPPADTIFAEGFESGNLSQWQDGVDPARHHVLTDGTFARSGSRYLEITYPAGGDGGYLGRFFMPGYDSVYVSYYIRFDPAWTGMTKLMSVYGDRIDNQWSAFGKAGICPNGTDFFNAFLTTEPGTGDPGNLRFYTYYPDMAREPDGVTCWGRYGDGSETYTPPLGLSKGVWHRIELWVKANTPGQYNAAQKVWIDGVLRGSWSGFRFRTTTDLRLNAFLIIATAAPTSVARKLYIDDIIILPSSPSP